MRLFPVLFLALAGCAAANPAPAVSPAASAKPEAAAESPDDCSAAVTGDRPTGWLAAGKIVVTLVDGKPTSIEIHDASGKSSPSTPIDGTTIPASRENLRKAVCLAGGVLGVVEGKPPTSGTITIDTLRPAKEDAVADLAILCAEPADMLPEADLGQRVRIARQMYGERLTSPRYRRWLHHLSVALHDENVAERVNQTAILATDAKAAGKTSCWFADSLRR